MNNPDTPSPASSTVEAITRLLFMRDDPAPVDLAFVFGSNWIPTMDPAIDLYKRKLVSQILISGASATGDANGMTECQVFRQYAVANGVPEGAILREERATNTLENFRLASCLIEETRGWDSIQSVAFICKTFHTRRVLMTAARNWPRHLRYIFLPVVDERDIRSDNWWRDETARKRVLEELRRIADYTLKGDIGDF